MKTTIERKQTAFRLRTDLMNELREEAKRENRSVNNLVEMMLSEALRERRYNPETAAALQEARLGKYAGTLDMSDFDSFMQSVNAID